MIDEKTLLADLENLGKDTVVVLMKLLKLSS